MFENKLKLPAPQDALKGRAEKMPVPPRHDVLDAPLSGPFPAGLETAMFALGCFWGAEKKFWQVPGVYTTAVGYAAGLWFHRFVLRTEAAVSVFAAPSKFMAARLVDWGIDPARVAYVPNFTSADPAPDRDGAHDRNGGISVGRVSSEKGLDVLLHALAAASDPHFAIVGDGPALTSMRALADELHLTRTEFTGRVDRKRLQQLLRHSRYMVIPSLWDENAPLAALEGLAAGMPLLASNAGGLPELVAEGRGQLFPPGDAGTLAGVIADWDTDPVRCARAGEVAREFASREFNPRKHKASLEEVYLRALG